MDKPLATVVELPQFERTNPLNLPETWEVIVHLSENPEAGELIPGTGGVRKLKWGMEGRGKRGGARVIYYYHNEAYPLFLLTAFAKNVRVDLSQAERNRLKALITELINAYAKKEAKQ